MKTIHYYNEKIEEILMHLNDDELTEWFESNTIVYNNPDLLEVINGDKTTNKHED